ncbi:MAG: dipeptidyl aminopeptidase/acylaminoacyl peptidase [Paraglaciecola sp.]|jgi:dipeptidyl aminopeptidase/acylaminoacyl peptidase
MYKTTKKWLLVLVTTGLFACSATDKTIPVVAQAAPAKIISPLASFTPKSAATGELSLTQIMADPDWLGRQPLSSYWADDSQGIFYQRKEAGTPLLNLWQRDIDTQGNGNQVAMGKLHHFSYDERVLNQHKDKSAWVFEGNIFVKNIALGQVRQLTQDATKATNLQFLLDGRLAYQQGNSFYTLNISSGFRQQLVSWIFGKPPQGPEEPEDYIAQQQLALIDFVAQTRSEQQQRFDRQQHLATNNKSLTPQPFYFPLKHQSVEASLSPDGRHLILVEQETLPWRNDDDLMPAYIGEDGRIKSKEVRQRVADAKPENQTVWLIDIAEHQQHELSYQVLPGYNEDVLGEVKRENAKAKGESYINNRLPRDIGLLVDWSWSQSAISWHVNGQQVAIMLEAWDNKDRWLVSVDLNQHQFINQHRLHDDAWVNYKFNSFGWLHNSEQLYYLSEESGYAHLYQKPLNGPAKALTSGTYEVDALTLTSDDRYMYFKANKKHPGIYEIYRVALQSGHIEALTDLNGMTDYALSPDEKQLLLTHSLVTLPPELYLQAAQPNAEVQRLTHTVSDAFLAVPWTAPVIVPVESSHTVEPIFARVYKPAEAVEDTEKKLRPAVVFTHGAGYLQNSHLGWSGYFREFMFHSLLAQQGYVVMDMDYRASAGYGRDWRTAIYRHMGKPEIDDLRDGINWLVKHAQVDRQRIGTYGGSYGGFLTYMALFTQPDLFQAGAALRPVSDWAHYNHGYTSNILNTPDIDPIAYQRSSPIYFAEGLRKPLLINAPMIDSNVFFVDTVRLVQRLIELQKTDFETAIYPVESHGFVQPSSWLDEYRRIYKLFDTNL